jgi:toxin ParE1/3/4
VNVIWSPRAIERVAEIAEHIAIDRPMAADEWVEEVFGAAERLHAFPESGRVVPELQRPEIREVVHRGCRIIYRVDPDRISILTVRHSRQLTAPEHLR